MRIDKAEVSNDELSSYEEANSRVMQKISANIIRLTFSNDELLRRIDGPMSVLSDMWSEDEALLFDVRFFHQVLQGKHPKIALTPHVQPIENARNMMNVQSEPLRLYRFTDQELHRITGKSRQEIADTIFDGIDELDIRVIALNKIDDLKKLAESNIVHYYGTDDYDHPDIEHGRQSRVQHYGREMFYNRRVIEDFMNNFLHFGDAYIDNRTMIGGLFERDKEKILAIKHDSKALAVCIEGLAEELTESHRMRDFNEQIDLIEKYEILKKVVEDNEMEIIIDTEQPSIIISTLDTYSEAVKTGLLGLLSKVQHSLKSLLSRK